MKKKMHGETKILAATGLVCGALFNMGCTPAYEGYDRITLETAAGINANADLMNGLIRTSKESGRGPSKYVSFREQQEKEITEREKVKAKKPGFIAGLFNMGGK